MFTLSAPIPIWKFLDCSNLAATSVEVITFKSNSLHITFYFEATLCVIVTYYLQIKITRNILY